MDGCPVDSPLVLGGAACCLVVSALVAVTSLGQVPPLYYGIRYNYFNKYADIDNIFGPGRHFIWPMNTFVIFPSDAQNIEFSNEASLPVSGRRYPALHTRTKEGLALHMQVSLQYLLNGPKVGALYKEFNLNYEEVFLSTIRDTLIKAAAEYKAAQLWKNRKEVGMEMQRSVNNALSTTYATCWGLQLMDIELPDIFDKSIVMTQVQRQNATTMSYSQVATVIRAETEVIMAQFNRNVTVIRATAEANYSLTTKKAKAQARSNILDIEADVLKKVQERLALTSEELVEYQQYTAIQQLNNASLFFGFEEDTKVLLSAGRRLATTTQTLAPLPRARMLEGELPWQGKHPLPEGNDEL